MARERVSKRTLSKQLGRIREQLDRIEHHIFRSLTADNAPPAATEPVEPAPGFEELRSVLDQLGQRIHEHMETWRQERDRLESRLRTLERAIARPAPKEPLIQELEAREAVFGQSAQKAGTAPSRPPPVDYVPVLTAAIQLMRDVGVCVIERCWTQDQKPPTPSKGS